MARSFLAAQIAEVRDGLKGLAGDLKNLGDVNSQVLSRSMGVLATGTGDGGSSGGGGRTQPGGPTILGPDGTPATPLPGYPLVGASSIAEFLRRRQESENARQKEISSMGNGSGSSGGVKIFVKPPSEEEKSIMKTLNEGVEYVRKLIAAAKWSGLGLSTVLRASKAERDALVAAYEEYIDSRTIRSTSTPGTGNNGQAPWWDDPDKLGPEWTVRWGGSGGDPGFSGGGGGGSGFSPGGNGGITGGAPQFNNNPFASKVAAVPTAGDRLVADTVGGVTKAIEKLAAKIDNQGNLAFRTKGL